MLLCEPYFGGSHRSWAEGLARHTRHDLRLVTHAGGFWKWRMEGAALTLAEQIDEVVAVWGRPDVVLASDMVHLPALVGFARRSLADVPVVLYMHENQLTYPTPPDTPRNDTYAMTNWLSLAVADRVVFNSEHHRRELLGQLPRFLRRSPDHRHLDRLAAVEAATTVLPVGVDLDRFSRPRPDDGGPPVVLWNHRWEYDKGPGAFFDALVEVAGTGVDFRVIVAGERFTRTPEAFEQGRRALGDRVTHFGTSADDDYPTLLARADIVVSTSRHEFFGVAVVEAIAAGAFPLLPRRLAYPELVGGDEAFLYDDQVDLVARLHRALTDPGARLAGAQRARTAVERFGWARVAPRYDDLLAEAAAADPGPSADPGRTSPAASRTSPAASRPPARPAGS